MSEDVAANVWETRGRGLAVKPDVFRPVTHDDIEYICNHVYPFIQLLKTGDPINIQSAKFVKTSVGWVIHDYGDAVTTSAPHGKTDDDDDSGEGGDSGSGKGTITGQQARAMEEMAKLIREKGWAAVELIAGTRAMQDYFALAAAENNITFEGYTLTEENQKRKERVAKMKELRIKVTAELAHVPREAQPE